MSKTLEQFEQYLDKMKKYEHINTLLYWDMRTCAPKLGQAGHIDALTYFSTESFAMSTSDELYGMLETLKTPEEFAQLSDTMKFIVTRMQRDMEKDRRIPKDRYKVMVREQAESGNAWEDAKNASDFSIFAPHLEKMIALTKEMAGYTDPGKEVYDVLLDKYEEGMDSATIDRLFGELKEALIPLVKKILDAKQPDDTKFHVYFDPDDQRKVQDLLLSYIGFSKDAGAVGETEHPFTLNFSSKDVRVTNHYYEHDPISAMFSAIHEGGHAIFEQNVNPEYDNTAAGSCRYMGVHESQSRFYENILGRNKNFWIPVYEKVQELMPQMTGVAKGLAGLGALFYVAYRVWQSLARAEPVDVFPFLRPFALGLCIMFFPTLVLGTLNSVMSPIVKGTHTILESQTFDMNEYRAQKDKLEVEAMKRNPETAYLVDKEAFDNKLDELGALDAIEACGMYVDRAMYNMKKAVQNFFRELLELMFNAAALVIDTLRTFFLIVLSILGPISFAISCWDGFQASLSQWFVRYISIYLWLPVSDLFSSVLARIQVLMLQQDIERLANPDFIPDGSNGVYITFLIIGIIGYFTIPTVANWIIQAGGGAGNYGKNVSQAASKTGSVVAGTAGAAVGNIAGRLIK